MFLLYDGDATSALTKPLLSHIINVTEADWYACMVVPLESSAIGLPQCASSPTTFLHPHPFILFLLLCSLSCLPPPHIHSTKMNWAKVVFDLPLYAVIKHIYVCVDDGIFLPQIYRCPGAQRSKLSRDSSASRGLGILTRTHPMSALALLDSAHFCLNVGSELPLMSSWKLI